MPVSSLPSIGAVINGRYRITRHLAAGGMSTVFLGIDELLDRRVALKFLHPHLAQQAEFSRKFLGEARSAARISSPNVVAIHDQGFWQTPTSSQAYIVMEYVPGPDLRAELSRLGNLNLATALLIAEQILRALAAAHDAGIIHRDVKPGNTLLFTQIDLNSANPDLRVKVADFGLARAVAGATSSALSFATPAYVAPEVISNGSITPAVDIYAAGIMLFELLAGYQPFIGTGAVTVAYQHVNRPLPLLRALGGWLPPEIDRFLTRLTAKDPARRIPDGASGLRELLELRAGLPEDVLLRALPTPANRPESEPPVPHKTAPAAGPAPTAPLDGADSPTAALGVHARWPEGSHTGQPQMIFPAASSSALSAQSPLETNSGARPARRKWPVITLALVFLACALGLGAWAGTSALKKPSIEIPDITGLSITDGRARLEQLGLETSSEEVTANEAAGTVIATDPAAGTLVNEAETVTVTVSAGK